MVEGTQFDVLGCDVLLGRSGQVASAQVLG